jgi:hypothetical protein
VARLDTTLGTVTKTDATGVYVELDREPRSEYGPCPALAVDPLVTGIGETGPEQHTHPIASRYVKGTRVAVTPLDGVADLLLVLGPLR